MTEPVEHLVELDDRRRVSLGRVGRPEHTRYLVREEPDGTLVFTPAVVMGELEAKLLANSELVDRIQTNRADPSRLVRRSRRRPANGRPLLRRRRRPHPHDPRERSGPASFA